MVKDTDNHIFGAYCCEQWGIGLKFYGIGESFIFKFDEEDIKVYEYTGLNEKIQFSDENCIVIGGGK